MGKKGYYKLLNVTKEATASEVKIAYRIKAKELHPDVNRDFDTTTQFQQLNEAYEVLSDVVQRKKYDDNPFVYISNGEINDNDFIKFNTNIDTLKCNCDDWRQNRSIYPYYDPRRLCKHLIAKFPILKVDHNANIIELDLPEELKPFQEYIKDKKYSHRGFKLFEEIVFLKSSIVVVDYYGTHLYLHLKKQKDSFCSYQVFEVHKYKGVGYKWMEQDDTEILFKDNIDGKDYINKRFKVINADMPLCNRLYKRFKEEEKYCQAQKYKEKYCRTTTKLLQQFESHYTTRTFNEKLKMMGYLVKFKELNNNKWIVKDDGLKYGINNRLVYEVFTKDIPDWYIFTMFDYKTMSYKDIVQFKPPKETCVMWEIQKFTKLLEIMDEYIKPLKPKKAEEKISKKEIERMKWLSHVSCHKCGSKNIHKKNKRVYGYGTVQRYQCMDCKSIFQEQIDENLLEEKNVNFTADVENEKSKSLNEQKLQSIELDFNVEKGKKSSFTSYVVDFMKKFGTKN